VLTLYRSAGFRGVRSQVGKAAALLRAEWRRRRGSEPMPRLPKVLPYVRRLCIESIPLTVWLSANKRSHSETERATGIAGSAAQSNAERGERLGHAGLSRLTSPEDSGQATASGIEQPGHLP
jgi:hypothetical protein